jgi:TonB family protein
MPETSHFTAKMHIATTVACLFASLLFARQHSYAQEPQANNRPSILTKPILNYPSEARVAGIEGTINVRARVGADGIVVKTEIAQRDPELAFVFDEEARRYVMRLTFTPASDSNGAPTSAWVSLPVHFSIPDFEPAALVEAATPELPDDAKELGIEGWVGLAVQVDDMGFVIRDPKPIIIAREHSNLTLFDKSAIDAARRSKFSPAHGKDGKQRAWAYVKIEFRIPDELEKQKQ